MHQQVAPAEAKNTDTICKSNLFFYQDKDDFCKIDEGMELAQAYWKEEEKLLEKKFAKIEAKANEIATQKREVEKEQWEVREIFAKMKEEKERKV